MAVKIRLARHGKKGYPVYHIVVADSRAPRDGRFIEKLGTYNPNTNPATININVDSAVKWLNNGAQPTDTCRQILSYKGALMKRHLLGGVKKGAFTMEVAEERFEKWLAEKAAKINAKINGLAENKANSKAARLAEEQKLNNLRIEAIAKKNAPEVEEAAEVSEEATEEVAEEAAAE